MNFEMENNLQGIGKDKVIVSLHSDANFLSLSILEDLLSKNCYISIITQSERRWRERTLHLGTKNKFAVVSGKTSEVTYSNYSIAVLGFLKGNPYEEAKIFLREQKGQRFKILLVIPFEKYSYVEASALEAGDNVGVVYVSDVLGARLDLESDLLASRLISGIFFNNRARVAMSEHFYPLFVSDVAKTLSKWLFSFGPYGKETCLVGPEVSAAEFINTNEKIVGKISTVYDEKMDNRKALKNIEVKKAKCDLTFALRETYAWASKEFAQNHERFKSRSAFKYKEKFKRNIPRPLFSIIATLGIIFALPFVLILLGSSLFLFSYKQFLLGNDNVAENTILVSKTFWVVSREESRGLSSLPLLKFIYRETFFISEVGSRLADAGIQGIPVVRETSGLANKILGNQVYDPEPIAKKISQGLGNLYKDISILQADTGEEASAGVLAAKKFNEAFDLEKLANLTLQGQNISNNLAALLGKNKSKTYLLLFQNNMELRPTGGFIGSFGLMTFDGGRITDLAVNDVYSADGQLNGHVEPPAPIKNYLGEANWFLRDSNWDPDFPTSAQRAEWFLDKETGRQVDGVIAIDLNPIKDVLKYTGPIFLADYNLDITTNNLYEKTQSEVQDNFFPGTHKKASFLTALSRNLLAEVSKLNTDQKVGILKSFYQNLDSRHIQMFIHDVSLQNSFAALSWNGEVGIPTCGDGCYPDWFGTVEANVGVNKANYFIKRSENFMVETSSGTIGRKLTITLKNTANPSLGSAARYKVYLRLLSPADSDVLSAKALTGNTPENLIQETLALKGRKETGVLVEVLAGQTKQIEFTWQSKEKNHYDKYGLYVRKQAGTSMDPLSLTVNGKSVYNSELISDYFNRFSF